MALTAYASEQSVVLVADADIASLSGVNSVQTVTFPVAPAAGEFTITLGRLVSQPIPVIASPPAAYGLFTLPVDKPVAEFAIVASGLTTYGPFPDQFYAPNPVVSSPIDTTGCNLIVVSLAFDRTPSVDYGQPAPTLSDSLANTWISLGEYIGTGGANAGVAQTLYYCDSPAVGPGHTFAATNPTTYALLGVVALSGASVTPLLAVTGQGGDSGATPATSSIQPGAVSPDQGGCLIVTAVCNQYGHSLAIDSGFTALGSDFHNFGNMGGGLATLIATAAGPINPTWSWTGGSDAAAVSAVFAPQSTPSVLSSGGTYTVAFGPATTAARIDILAGSVVVASTTIAPPATPIAASVAASSTPLAFTVPAGTTAIRVLVTAPSDGESVTLDSITITHTTTGLATTFDVASTAFRSVGMTGTGSTRSGNLTLGGPVFAVNPQAISLALGSTDFVVTGSGLGPFTFTATNGLAGQAVEPITCSEPTAEIASTSQGLTLTRNGSPIPLGRVVWGTGQVSGYPGGPTTNIGPYCRYAQFLLTQSAPLATYFPFGAGESSINTYSYQQLTAPGLAYSYKPILVGSGFVVTVPLDGFVAGTYELFSNWVPQTGLATAVSYAIREIRSSVIGATLAIVTVDQTANPTDLTDQGLSWKSLGSYAIDWPVTGFSVEITSASGNYGVDTIQVRRTSPDLTMTIEPTDVLSLTIPSGCLSLTSGSVPATTLAVVNQSSISSLAGVDLTQAKMPLGYNIAGDYYSQTALQFSNIGLRASRGLGSATSVDVNGYPLTAAKSQLNTIAINLPNSDLHGDGKGLPCAPPGPYTLLWDGASTAAFQNLSNDIQTVVSSHLTGTTDNALVVDCQPNGDTYSPNLWLQINSTGTNAAGEYTYDFRNLRIYPPNAAGQPQSSAPKFDPSYIAKLKGVNFIRAMDALEVTICNTCEFTDLKTSGSLAGSVRSVSITISSIAAPAGVSLFDPAKQRVLELACAQPHTLFDYAWVSLQITQTTTFSDGTSLAPGSYPGAVRVVSPTVLQWCWGSNNANVTMVGTATGGTVSIEIGTSLATEDIIDLANEVGCGVLYNLALTQSADCVTQIAQACLALTPGQKIYLEVGNENWNYSFPTYYVACALSYQYLQTPGASSDWTTGSILKSQELHAAFLAVWEAAGRGGDVVRCFGTQGASPGETSDLVSVIQNHKVPCDAILVAPYIDNFQIGRVESNLMRLYDDMTAIQGKDHLELILKFGNYWSTYVSDHRAILDAAGMTGCRIIGYEGGLNTANPGGSTVNAFARSYAIARHPDIYPAMVYAFQAMQTAGMDRIAIYYLFGGGLPLNNDGTEVTQQFPSVWSTWLGWNQQPGTGNRVADALNITNPNAVNQIKSEVGGAVQAWSAAIAAATTPGGSPFWVALFEIPLFPDTF